MNFALFLLLNAILLVRPEELFPEIAGLRLYLITIVLCTATSLPKLLSLLSVGSLQTQPVSVCVLIYLASTVVSLCVHGQMSQAFFDFGPEFAKVVLYYFLLIAVVDTRTRFRVFVAALVVLTSCLTVLALAQQYGYADFPNMKLYTENRTNPLTGDLETTHRLVSSGLFHDPNDLCLILGLGILSCIYCSTTSSMGLFSRVLWLLPLPLLLYGFFETHSRGGMIGVGAGVVAYLYSRYGARKTLPLAVVGIVTIFASMSGRQVSLEEGGGTAHDRLMLWANGLTCLFAQWQYLPTGLGIDWYVESEGFVAHNSFVQAFVEQGLLGGGAFAGMFYLAVRILPRCGKGFHVPAWVKEARHFGFAVVMGYGMGCYSLTRNHVVPTYLALGLASVLLNQAASTLPERYRVNGTWFTRAAIFSVCGLVFIKLVTQGLCLAGL